MPDIGNAQTQDVGNTMMSLPGDIITECLHALCMCKDPILLPGALCQLPGKTWQAYTGVNFRFLRK